MKTPKAPDPVATAQAQSGMNRDTAIAQNLTNMIGQVGPWGSVSYNQTGTTGYIDSTGKYVSVPQFTQTTSYSPEQQAIFDKTTEAQTNLAGIAADQSAWMADYLKDPFTFDNQDAADWAYDLASTRIRPEQQARQRDLEASLVNSGIRRGTAAWDREMARMTNANNDQMNQLALQGRSQAFGEALTQRNQPINELTAFMSGSQINAPNAGMSATPQAQVAGVDYTGLVNNQYQAQLANRNSMMGGLFGLAGALGGAAIASDVRLKTDISRVGTLDNGLPVYAYRYKDGGPMQIGVMAQDVMHVNPGAVSDIGGGYMGVDYGKAVA